MTATTSPPDTRSSADTRDVELASPGMTCAACAARVEKKLNKLDDVVASVNYATATARVSAPAAMPVQDLITAVEKAGYGATAPTVDQPEQPDGQDDARHAAALKRRLIVALVFYLPLTDLSLMLSLVPTMRFPGWQWLLGACAAPGAVWCAWPVAPAAPEHRS